MITKMKTIAATTALAAMMTLGANAAYATTITVSGTDITVECDGALAQDCKGVIGGSLTLTSNEVTGGALGSLSDEFADYYNIGNNSVENEIAALTELVDGFTYTTGVKTEDLADSITNSTKDVDTYEFDSDAEYIAFKTGGGHFFLKLLGSETITLNFAKNGESAGGLSHYTEFGQLSPIPLPAAGWLLLMGIGGLGVASRRRRKAQHS